MTRLVAPDAEGTVSPPVADETPPEVVAPDRRAELMADTVENDGDEELRWVARGYYMDGSRVRSKTLVDFATSVLAARNGGPCKSWCCSSDPSEVERPSFAFEGTGGTMLFACSENCRSIRRPARPSPTHTVGGSQNGAEPSASTDVATDVCGKSGSSFGDAVTCTDRKGHDRWSHRGVLPDGRRCSWAIGPVEDLATDLGTARSERDALKAEVERLKGYLVQKDDMLIAIDREITAKDKRIAELTSERDASIQCALTEARLVDAKVAAERERAYRQGDGFGDEILKVMCLAPQGSDWSRALSELYASWSNRQERVNSGEKTP